MQWLLCLVQPWAKPESGSERKTLGADTGRISLEPPDLWQSTDPGNLVNLLGTTLQKLRRWASDHAGHGTENRLASRVRSKCIDYDVYRLGFVAAKKIS